MSSEQPIYSEIPPRASLQKQPVVDQLIGRVLAEKFKIVSLLARGGMGKVYKAEQAPLGRACAIKVLTPPENSDSEDEFHKRFFLEASIGAKLTHPNTVTIFDYGKTDDGVYFIAMEYLEGKTLARVLKEEGPFAEERATHIARQICRSLREAHALGVVHRDMKPANVYLVGHSDEVDVVKVLDFGLVKDVEHDGEDLTQTGLFMGSPKYMAPEQIRGEAVDGRTDIYALGVMLYEMMTGKVPYDRPKQVDTLLAHVNASLPSMREKKPDLVISEHLETIILRCLAKNPAERFNDMGEVLESLKLTATSSLTGTRELESLRASASFTPQESPILTGSIPAAASLSIAPTAAEGSSKKKWIPLAIGAIAVAAAALVYVGRSNTAHKVDAPASEAKPVVTEPAPKPEVKPPPVATTAAAPAPKVEEIYVSLDTEPTGARVRDEQKAILCDKTPCKLQVPAAGTTVLIEIDGYSDQKVKLSTNDPPRMIKLTKAAAAPRPAAPKPTATATAAAPPPTGTYHPDPY
ncbi:MAG: serine/threonine protein kinase [Deltaproteobacteria bacterium]|nr:serine/threonine protein kinase [Deltaproteobacteria bacterium]